MYLFVYYFIVIEFMVGNVVECIKCYIFEYIIEKLDKGWVFFWIFVFGCFFLWFIWGRFFLKRVVFLDFKYIK